MKNKNLLAVPFIILLFIAAAVVTWFLITSNAGIPSNPSEIGSSANKKIEVSKGLKSHIDPTSVNSDSSSNKSEESSSESDDYGIERAANSRDDSMKQINAGKQLIRDSMQR